MSIARSPSSARNCLRRSLRRASMATLAPHSTRARHVASPMPLEAPVTTSRRPTRFTVMATRRQPSVLFADSHQWAMNGSMLRLTSSMRGPVRPLA